MAVNQDVMERAARPAAPGFFGKGQRVVGLLALLVALAMGLSGLLALDSGLLVHPKPFFNANAAEERAAFIQQLRTDEQVAQQRIFGLSAEAGLVAKATSTQHVLNSRLPELSLYYTSMPKLNVAMLATHTALAAFCMLVGAFQFWPAFRRRFPLWHRRFGKLYVFTALPSMVFAMAYLLLISPYQLYTGLTGYVALWIVALLVPVTIIMAMVHLKRREIAQHQAYMALSFGMLMVAPLLRWTWVVLAQFLPGVEQETLNLSTLIFLVPEALLISYALMALNRSQQRLRPKPLVSEAGELVRGTLAYVQPLLLLLALACVATTTFHFLVAPGLEQSSHARQIVPLTQLQYEAAVLGGESLSRVLFVLANGIALLLAAAFFGTAFRQGQGDVTPRLRLLGMAVALSVGLSSALLLRWGWMLGVPVGMAQFSGGTFYTTAGVLGLAFSGLLLAAVLRNRLALVKEWGMFALICAFFPALFYWALAFLSWLPWPLRYVADGQLYELAAGSAPFMLLIGFFYTIHSQATRERFAV